MSFLSYLRFFHFFHTLCGWPVSHIVAILCGCVCERCVVRSISFRLWGFGAVTRRTRCRCWQQRTPGTQGYWIVQPDRNTPSDRSGTGTGRITAEKGTAQMTISASRPAQQRHTSTKLLSANQLRLARTKCLEVSRYLYCTLQKLQMTTTASHHDYHFKLRSAEQPRSRTPHPQKAAALNTTSRCPGRA